MMTRKVIPIALMGTIGLMGMIAGGAIASPNSQYGSGQLDQRQTNVIDRKELAFPQSYQAIVKKFGYPNDSDQWADYYRLADGRWVAVVYDGHADAIYVTEVQ